MTALWSALKFYSLSPSPGNFCGFSPDLGLSTAMLMDTPKVPIFNYYKLAQIYCHLIEVRFYGGKGA